jgi:hypothetical protein
MESILNLNDFAERLAYYLKVGIFINKGTTDDVVLDKCIKWCNNYVLISKTDKLSEEQESFMRKNIKRINLIMKVDDNGNPIDIRNKEYQTKILSLKEHESIYSNNLDQMINYSTLNNVHIFPGISLMFILRESKYRELLWQYTRSIFYFTQLFIAAGSKSNKEIKKKITDSSLEMLEDILNKISEIEEDIKLTKIINADKFLSAKIKDINKEKINNAANEVKNIFVKKGLGENNSMTRIVDSISEKLGGANFMEGNVIQNVFNIATSIISEVKGDIDSNPENLKSTIETITEVLHETINGSSDEVPSEVKSIFGLLSKFNAENQSDESTEEITKQLQLISSSQGLDYNELFSAVSVNGKIDASKLDSTLRSLKN